MGSHFWKHTIARCYHFFNIFLSPSSDFHSHSHSHSLILVLSHLSFSDSPSRGSDGSWWLQVGHGSDSGWHWLRLWVKAMGWSWLRLWVCVVGWGWLWVCGGWVVGVVVIGEVGVGFGCGFVVGFDWGCWGGGFWLRFVSWVFSFIYFGGWELRLWLWLVVVVVVVAVTVVRGDELEKLRSWRFWEQNIREREKFLDQVEKDGETVGERDRGRVRNNKKMNIK